MGVAKDKYIQCKNVLVNRLHIPEKLLTKAASMNTQAAEAMLRPFIMRSLRGKSSIRYDNMYDYLQDIKYFCAYKKAVHIRTREVVDVPVDTVVDSSWLSTMSSNDVFVIETYGAENDCIITLDCAVSKDNSAESAVFSVNVYLPDGDGLQLLIHASKELDYFMCPDIPSCASCGICPHTKLGSTKEKMRVVKFTNECTHGLSISSLVAPVVFAIDTVSTYLKLKATNEIKTVPTASVKSRKPGTVHESVDDKVYDLRGCVTYRYAEKSVPLGGHHASPVAHPRREHYRRVATGAYTVQDGDYVFVGKGNGTHTHVRNCVVNAHKDNVKINSMLTV